MKKAFLLFLCIFIISACSNGKTQSLEEFYKEAGLENIDKIIIQDGSTGASKIITKKEQIDHLLSQINNIIFTPQDNQEKRVGWRYGITLFDGEINFNFTLEEIGKTYYKSNPDIFPIVDEFYKQLEIEEE